MTGPCGVWLGASLVLGRPVPVDDRYPHLCGTTLTGTMTGRGVRLTDQDCAACPARPDRARRR